MDAVGEIEHRGAFLKAPRLALGGEDENVGGGELLVEVVEELDGVGVGVLDYLADFLEPVVHLEVGGLLVRLSVFLVEPVGRHAPLCDGVHPLGTDLDLHPGASGRHHGEVQGLVAV